MSEFSRKLALSRQASSDQLLLLANQTVLEARREGLQIHYPTVDPGVLTVLHRGWRVAEGAQGRAFERAEAIAS